MKVVEMKLKENAIAITLESPLLADYFPNFKSMIMGYKGGIPGLSVNKIGSKGAEIQLPVSSQKCVDVNDRMVAYSLDPVFVEQLDFFDEFAIKKKLMSTEFIPLTGYDIEMMSEEVVEAVKAKRNLLFIKSFDEYKSMSKSSYEFNQYELEYGTTEYVDAVIMIRNKDIKALRKLYSGKLECVNWTGK